jgi:hypothetical protein
MPTHTTPSLLTLAALGALTVPAAASIVTVSGQTTLIGPPIDCSINQLAGTTAFAWDEQQNVSVTGLPTDETQNPGGTAAPVFGVLSGVYDSHFLHFQGIPLNNAAGSVTFSGPIVGVIWNNAFLDISDGQAGAPGTIYPTGYPTRGLLAPPPGVLSVNANVLTFNFQNAFTPNDLVQVRILTQVPAPGACGLLATAGIFAARRRR